MAKYEVVQKLLRSVVRILFDTFYIKLGISIVIASCFGECSATSYALNSVCGTKNNNFRVFFFNYLVATRAKTL